MVERVFRGITYTVETATANDQTLNGTPNPDWIEALGGDNRVATGAGNDVVLAGVGFGSIANYAPYGGEAIFYSSLPDAGNNTIFTGAGDDYVAVTSGNDLVRLGEGNDIFDGGGGGNDTVYGGAGNDIIDLGRLSPGDKLIRAGAGNDSLSGSIGGSTGDTLDGGAGEDFLPLFLFDQTAGIVFDGTASTHLTLADGTTARNWEVFDVFGGSGNDTLTGGAGDDSLVGFSGIDIITGGAGDDSLGGDTGDTLDGGAGEDFLSLSLFDQTVGIVFDGTASTHLTLADGTTARNGEVFSVSDGSGNDMLIGGVGNDSLSGGTGDTLDGGAGEDFLSLDLSDQLAGIVFDGTTSADITLADGTTLRNGEAFNIFSGSGNDTLIGGTRDDSFSGNDGDDSLRGGAGNDFLSGGSGSDSLRGGVGDDFLDGDDGDDSLRGGVGDDFLDGGSGSDVLNGASFIDFGVGSVDTLIGGSESDRFVLGAVGGVFYDSDQVNSPASTDYAQITDFDFSQDGIQLTGAAINYSLVEEIIPNIGLSGTSIYLADQTNELIAVVTEVTGLDLNASYFSYV